MSDIRCARCGGDFDPGSEYQVRHHNMYTEEGVPQCVAAMLGDQARRDRWESEWRKTAKRSEEKYEELHEEFEKSELALRTAHNVASQWRSLKQMVKMGHVSERVIAKLPIGFTRWLNQLVMELEETE